MGTAPWDVLITRDAERISAASPLVLLEEFAAGAAQGLVQAKPLAE